MKKKQLAALLVAIFVLATAMPAGAAPHRRVTPRTESDSGWFRSSGTTSGAPTARVRYRGGPAIPPLSTNPPVSGGSLHFSQGSEPNAFAEASTFRYNGVGLAQVTNLDYSTFAESDPTGTNGSPVPRIELGIDRNNDGVRDDEIVFDPACQTPPTGSVSQIISGRWQTWDADNGLWYASTAISNTSTMQRQPSPSCGNRITFTFRAYASANASARIISRIRSVGGLALTYGTAPFTCSAPCTSQTGAAGSFGDADNLTFESNAGFAVPFSDTWDFDPDITTVLSDRTEGWTIRASNTGSFRFEDGPVTPHYGVGSIRMMTGVNGDSVVEGRHPYFDGMKVKEIARTVSTTSTTAPSPTTTVPPRRTAEPGALGYSTYVRTGGGVSDNAPYLLLEVSATPDAVTPQAPLRLRFEPRNQPGGVAPGAWQRWDPAGGLWERSDIPGTTPFTLEAFVTANPEAVVVPAAVGGGGFAVAVGGGGASQSGDFGAIWSGFDGHVDGVTMERVRAPGTEDPRTYDFEPGLAGSTTPTTLQPGGGPPTTFCCQQTTTTTADPNTTTTTSTTAPPGGTTTTTSPSGGTTTTTTTPPSGTTTTTTTRPAGAAVQRVSGGDRFTTAIEVSKRSYSDQGAGSAVIARADNYPDALAAAPLAASTRGPVLLSLPGDLESRTRAEVGRVLPKGRTVYLVGGLSALSAAIESALRADGYNVTRFAGRNRFETATLVAESMPTATAAMLVTGDNFPDALSAGAAASDVKGVVLLTNGRGMPAETSAYLRARPNMPRYAIGGAAAAADPGATAIVGADRFETAVNVATRFFPSPSVAGIASGLNYPDALAGGPHVGSRGGPILLTRFDSLPTNVREYLSARKASLRDVFIYGGTSVVSQQAEADAQASVR